MFEILVLAMMAILVAFVAAWAASAAFRSWIEIPKHRMLDRERRFDDRDRT